MAALRDLMTTCCGPDVESEFCRVRIPGLARTERAKSGAGAWRAARDRGVADGCAPPPHRAARRVGPLPAAFPLLRPAAPRPSPSHILILHPRLPRTPHPRPQFLPTALDPARSPSDDLCRLAPIICDGDGKLTQFVLPGASINCKGLGLPPSFASLNKLETLDLAYNEIGSTASDMAAILSSVSINAMRAPAEGARRGFPGGGGGGGRSPWGEAPHGAAPPWPAVACPHG